MAPTLRARRSTSSCQSAGSRSRGERCVLPRALAQPVQLRARPEIGEDLGGFFIALGNKRRLNSQPTAMPTCSRQLARFGFG